MFRSLEKYSELVISTLSYACYEEHFRGKLFSAKKNIFTVTLVFRLKTLADVFET